MTKWTSLHSAAMDGDVDKVRKLLEQGRYDVNCVTSDGTTLLHIAAVWGRLGVVRVLVSEFKANVNARTKYGVTPFSSANVAVALALINEFDCDTFGGTSFIHPACRSGSLNLVRALVGKHGIGILNHCDSNGDTPLHKAARWGRKEVAMMLINEYHCDTSVKGHKGRSLLHSACAGGDVSLVQTLILEHNGDITARDDEDNTPLHMAARKEVAMMLINEYHCDTAVKGHKGRSLLHSACEGGDVSLVRTFILEHKGDITARDDEDNTPLHVAAEHNREKVLLALVSEFDPACSASKNRSAIKHFSSLWMVNSDGDTPLHICSREGHVGCVQTLLKFNPPVMIRNSSGQTPRNVAHSRVAECFEEYVRENKDNIYSQYEVILTRAIKKYSLAERITRVFVIGNRRAGKSSLIEALKREGFFSSLKRVSESSVPPHTAGIVPSIHTSKHYGRVLFYDFAGDAEYYSSHAAILENLASSTKGDNIFIIVVNLRDDMAKIRTIFQYWVSFVEYQQFSGHKPYLIAVGSHLDLLTEEVAKNRGDEFCTFCESIKVGAVHVSGHFMLDCCKPRSKHIADIQDLMVQLTKNSPCFKLSFPASMLLGLLEKDFSHVPICSIQQLLAHIEETGIQLPTEAQALLPVLSELHDLGLLFIVNSSNVENMSIVLNVSQLTNIVHKSLFSEEAKPALKEIYDKEGLTRSFSAGVIPQKILAKILPRNIAMECLVQLQYCQEIGHSDVHAFPSLKASDFADQSFLFFPALCSADKSEVEWVTPTDLSYGIGWLARCTDLCDFFPQRFLHVLLLRLVFRFTLSAHSPPDQVSRDSPDHSFLQHRCTMWKTGVHWLMEEGVECMVELVNANKEVVVLTKSIDATVPEENCTAVFNDIIICVMETKADCCRSARLEFFLLDSTSTNYLDVDNLFAMSDVERVLLNSEKACVLSKSGKGTMKRSKLLCLLKFTLWHELFPIDFISVLGYIKEVFSELYDLGLHLGLPRDILDAVEADLRVDAKRSRRELVKGWMSSSPDPPCWWHLVEALHAAARGELASRISKNFSKFIIRF